jgi:hypothetical protein
MRKRILFGLLAGSIMLIAGRESAAQEHRLKSASAEFRSFYSKFIAAVHRGDKTTVASMTSFPLTYGYDAGDEGKYTKKEFLRIGFKQMFGSAPRTFLNEKNPIVSRNGTSYIVSTTDATHLIFTKGGKRFFFTDYLVEP